jgi:hypothetical protein
MKPFFPSKSQNFGLEQTNWADKFWSICGIFSQFITTHFGTVRPLSLFLLINQYFYKILSLYIQIPNVYLGLGFEYGSRKN